MFAVWTRRKREDPVTCHMFSLKRLESSDNLVIL